MITIINSDWGVFMRMIVKVVAVIIILFIVSVMIFVRLSSDKWDPHWDGTSLTTQISNPFSEYDLSKYKGRPQQVLDKVYQKYSVPLMVKEGDCFIEPLSFAVFWSKELWEANLNTYIQKIRKEDRERVLYDIRETDVGISTTIDLILYSKNLDYIDIDWSSDEDESKSIFMETDRGKIIKSWEIISRPLIGAKKKGMHGIIIKLVFLKDEDDEPYIDEKTKWIRIWVKKGEALVYSQFDFAPMN